MAIYTQTMSDGNNSAQQDADGSNFGAAGATLQTAQSNFASARRSSAYRFTNVTIPQGTTILAAYIQVVPKTGQTEDDPCISAIRCEDADDNDDFATNPTIVGRSYTSAGTAWLNTNIGTGSYKTSPDFTAAVQEVINRPGWASGNAIVVFFEARTAAGGPQLYVDGVGVGLQPPILTIEYVGPATPRIDIVTNVSTRPAADWLAGFSTLPEPPAPSGGRDLLRFIR